MVLPTEKVLFEYADCVGEGRCVCIGTQEPDGFSFHQSLEDTPGVGRRKMEILESVSRLECVLRSRRLVWENLSPLWMFRSRNCTCVSEMLHVNLMLGCTLLSLSKKPSSWLLDPVQMQRMCRCSFFRRTLLTY